MSWHDAQAYVSWLSRTSDAAYRLPTEAEWERAAAGSRSGCWDELTRRGTCPVGSYGANGVGLFDMRGNLWEWLEECPFGDCSESRWIRGGAGGSRKEDMQRDGNFVSGPSRRADNIGFHVARPLE